MRRFHDRNPIAVALYYLCVVGITMFTTDPVILNISLVASVVSFCLYTKHTAKAHVFSAFLFIILAFMNPLLVHKGMTVLFYFNSRPVTLEAVVYGVIAAEMITASLYWLRLFSKAMTADKLLYLFGRFSPKISLILSMTIRYVELLRCRWRKIQDAQRALGLYDDGNLIDALRGRARVFSILITWALENGIITAESMDARGYGVCRRTSFKIFRIRLSDVILMLASGILAVVGVIGIHAAEVSYYPILTAELSAPLSIAGDICFGVLAFLPVIINTKEAIRWNCLNCAG